MDAGLTDEVPRGVSQRGPRPTPPPGLIGFHLGLQLGVVAVLLLPIPSLPLLSLLDLSREERHRERPLRVHIIMEKRVWRSSGALTFDCGWKGENLITTLLTEYRALER